MTQRIYPLHRKPGSIPLKVIKIYKPLPAVTGCRRCSSFCCQMRAMYQSSGLDLFKFLPTDAIWGFLCLDEVYLS